MKELTGQENQEAVQKMNLDEKDISKSRDSLNDS